jgi:ESCRT-I complex subunit VPS28
MDAIKLNQVAVDQLHPMLGDLLRSINRISSVKGEIEWKSKLKNW